MDTIDSCRIYNIFIAALTLQLNLNQISLTAIKQLCVEYLCFTNVAEPNFQFRLLLVTKFFAASSVHRITSLETGVGYII